MSSFDAEKRQEHETAAEQALLKGAYRETVSHLIQAGRYSLKLAEQSSGDLAQAHFTRAQKLRKLAEQVMGRINDLPVQNVGGAADSPAGEDETGMRLAERPTERLKDVSGMEEAKKFVYNSVIVPILDPAKAQKYDLDKGGGLLLYGLPGTGKTFFAKAVAGELGVPFYVLDTSKVMGKYVGESEKAVKALFDTARQNPMSVIFIDETNGVMPSRHDPNVHETVKKVEDIILQEVDGITSGSKNPFLLIGATNYPGNLDDAALARFRKRIEIELPDGPTRRFILEREIKRMQITFDDKAFDFLEEKTASFSCREVVQCAKALKEKASEEDVTEFSLDFCRKNFEDNHIISVEVAESIAEFKKRIV